MKKLITCMGMVALSVAVFGTRANANPPVVAHPVAPAPTAIQGTSSQPPTISYGVVGGAFVTKAFPAGSWQKCSNDTFGSDPDPNKQKSCFSGNTRLGVEGQMIDVPGPACPMFEFKYVAPNGASTSRMICPGRSMRCSNEAFGQDPAVGQKKHCDINGHTITQEGGVFAEGRQACLCRGESVDHMAAFVPIIENTSQN